MTKLKYKLITYKTPEAIEKYNKQIKLEEEIKRKETSAKELEDIEKRLVLNPNDTSLLGQRDELRDIISEINNSIINIKSDLYNSTVNFHNSNINQLTAQINDISKIIDGNKKFSDDLAKGVSEILSNQLTLNDIFKADNFKDLLTDIYKGMSTEFSKEVQEKINKIISEINLSESVEEIKNKWKELKDVLPETDKIKDILDEYTSKINDYNMYKENLMKKIFKKEVKSEELNEYIQKFNLLYDAYGLAKEILENKYLQIDSNKLKSQLHISTEELKFLVNNLRKWFSKDPVVLKEVTKTTIKDPLISDMMLDNLDNADFVFSINLNDILNTLRLLENIKIANGDLKYINSNVLKESLSAGLENNDRIEKKLDTIIDLLQKLLIRSSPSDRIFSGKFDYEKYNPNMSITDFKKLFNKD